MKFIFTSHDKYDDYDKKYTYPCNANVKLMSVSFHICCALPGRLLFG